MKANLERSNKLRREEPERYRSYQRKSNQKRKAANREWLLNYLNVPKIACSRCGYSEFVSGIDLHHLSPEKKDGLNDRMAHWLFMSNNKFQSKILNNDFIFLCRNCHAALHSYEWKIEEIKKE